MAEVVDHEDDLDLRFRVGTSVLVEFARSHSPADVLRELVQNEYDAFGTELVIEFGHEALVVHGNGQPIDRRGWTRLSVMLGTGLVAGSDERIDAKVNGIGSKNFGMRSLFLFGDRIDVASGGRRTILHRTRGSLDQPLADPPSVGTRGVRITVPYRRLSDGPLRPFDEAYEREALRTIATELAPTLMKLAQPRSGKSLRSLTVRSARVGEELRWRQTVRAVPGVEGALRRAITVDGSEKLLGQPKLRIAEIEHQASVAPPQVFRTQSFPAYYRAPGGRVRVGVSFRLKRDRLDLDAAGTLYYPLEARASRTGFPLSLNAPFETTEDRSDIIDSQNSPWNAWLLAATARLAVRFLCERLFPAYGSDAYAALEARSPLSSSASDFSREIERLLRSEHCWPSRARRRSRPVFAAAGDLVVPADRHLAGFVVDTINATETLDDTLAERNEVRALAARSGAATFTVNSLVRLRCAGEDDSVLATRLDPEVESNRYFTNFPAELGSLAVQLRFAAALGENESLLKDAHRADLRRSATTMTASTTLAAPDAPLWVVDESLVGIVPKGTALHPELARYRVLTALCRAFNASNWAIDVVDRMAEGRAAEVEREALVHYLRGQPRLSKKAWAAVRRAPVLVDRSGTLTAPADMVSSVAKGAETLAPALRLPRPDDEANLALRPLQFRSELRGSDLVNLAELVEQGGAPASAMRAALTRLPGLVTRSALKKLRDIRFLEASSDALLAPPDTYVRSDRLVALLGDNAPYATQLPSRLLLRLGSRVEPKADDLISVFTRLRESGGQPTRPDLAYRALVEALGRERRSAGQFEDAQILWTDHGWETPADCLVSPENRKTFFGAVTVLPEAQRSVWISLGARTTPGPTHWGRLLKWIGQRYGSADRVPQRPVEALMRAYRQLDALPEEVPPETECLLGDDGRLHAVSEAVVGRFVINDHPALAAAAAASGIPLAFSVALDSRATSFLVAAGARHLSEVAQTLGTVSGEPLSSEHQFRTAKVLSRLRRPEFASAVTALISAIAGTEPPKETEPLAERLGRIDHIVVVDGIEHRYRLAGTTVAVAGEGLVLDDRILVSGARRSYDLRRAVADVVATIADRSALAEQLLGDPVYFLLRCGSVMEMQRELRRRRIAWVPPSELVTDEDDEGADDESVALADTIGRSVIESAIRPRPERTGSRDTASTSLVDRNRPPLPELKDVRPRPALREEPRERTSRDSSGGGWASDAAPRDPESSEEDRALGRRGEEIVLGIERARVAKLGRSADDVIWTADRDQYADHDIKSVDDDGEELWIEVKSTAGRDGRFLWPASEFRLAVRARGRYVLYRVYEAGTLSPPWSPMRDPIGQFELDGLRLDLDRLVGDVGPLCQPNETAESSRVGSEDEPSTLEP